CGGISGSLQGRRQIQPTGSRLQVSRVAKPRGLRRQALSPRRGRPALLQRPGEVAESGRLLLHLALRFGFCHDSRPNLYFPAKPNGVVAGEPIRTMMTSDSRTDAQLMTAFLQRKDEQAFEVLVQRHESVVLSVCTRVLRDEH